MGWSPLHLSTYFGHQLVTEQLLEHGADINAVNDAGDTPLHKAAFIGREVIFKKWRERTFSTYLAIYDEVLYCV